MRPTFLLIPLLTTACLVPVTRDGFIARAAIETCESERACDDIGEDGDWDDMEDCLDAMEDVFEGAWSEDDCQAEDFDRDAFKDCVDDAREAACDDEFFDQIDAVSSCRAAVVCSD